MAQARDLLVDRGEDGRHLATMEGVRSGLESSLAQIEKVRTTSKAGWTWGKGTPTSVLQAIFESSPRNKSDKPVRIRLKGWHRVY